MKWNWPWRRDGSDGQQASGPRPEPRAEETSTILTGDTTEDAHSLQILLDTIAAVTANIDLDTVLSDIVDRSLEVTSAERALLLLGDSPDSLVVRVARDRDGNALEGDLQWSRKIVGLCLQKGSTQRAVLGSDQEALTFSQSMYDMRLRAVMCAPMRARNRTVGVIYVDSRAKRREFSVRDQALFHAISAQLAISIENARLHADSLEKARLAKEMDVVNDIQQRLLPTVPRGLPRLDADRVYVPAEKASGDSYDLVPMRDGRLAVMIGDVSGHGVGSALLNHSVQAALRSYIELIDDLSDIVTRINGRLARSVEVGKFMSLVLAIVDPVKRTLHYVNAGHPGVILVRGRDVRVLEKTGMVLGVDGDQVYEQAPAIELQPGDLLFLHTDGVDEAKRPGGEVFGAERLCQVLAAADKSSVQSVLGAVKAALHEHLGGEGGLDDITMIAVKLA